MWMIFQKPLVSASPSPMPINLKIKVSHECSSSFAIWWFLRLLVCLDGFTKELMMHSKVSKGCTQMWQWLNLLCTQETGSNRRRTYPSSECSPRTPRRTRNDLWHCWKMCSGVLSRLEDTAASVPWRRNRDVKCMCWKGPIWWPPGQWAVKGIWTRFDNKTVVSW